jgi:hypothetical protein
MECMTEYKTQLCGPRSWENVLEVKCNEQAAAETSRLGVAYAQMFENICCKGWCENTGLIFSHSTQ